MTVLMVVLLFVWVGGAVGGILIALEDGDLGAATAWLFFAPVLVAILAVKSFWRVAKEIVDR